MIAYLFLMVVFWYLFIILHFEFKQISDFGLSSWKAYQTTHSKSKHGAVGTVTHIPPERWNDANLKPQEAHDVYAFAVLCWELFSEQIPFEGKCVA